MNDENRPSDGLEDSLGNNYQQTPAEPGKTRKLLAAPKKSWDWLRFKHSNMTTRQKVIFWICMVLGIALGTTGVVLAYEHFHKPPPSVYSSPKLPPPKPTTEPSRLTGVLVDPSLNQRPVTGIMIENSPDARPQSGLREAGVIYEAVAEGGITRFLALYQEAQPKYIGPVRSVRPYYLDFLIPFNASIAHVGGAPQALKDIKALHVRDLDEFFNAGAYWRITSRYAPHNMYTSFPRLDALEKSKGYTSSKFTGFARKADSPAKVPTVTGIDFAISGYFYNVHYDYVAKTNSYLRSEGGKPHVDAKTGKQLNPKVVIALVMQRGIASDGEHTNYADVGKGVMYVFQDGKRITGTWVKKSRTSQFAFIGGDGKPIKLNAGQTWITVVDPGSVTFK